MSKDKKWKSPIWIAECAFLLRRIGNDKPLSNAKHLYDAYFDLGCGPAEAIEIDREHWE